MWGVQSKVGQGYKFSSVGSRFKRQLHDLMEALHKMEPHYIRCIKPNSFNRRAHLHHLSHALNASFLRLLCISTPAPFLLSRGVWSSKFPVGKLSPC